MPFDGTPRITESRSTRAALMLDYLIEFFDGGRNWHRGYYSGPEGTRCLVQAMGDLSRRHRLTGHGAGRYILRAIRDVAPSLTLMRFNDTCGSYDKLDRVLRRARVLVDDGDRNRAPERDSWRADANRCGGAPIGDPQVSHEGA